MEQKEKLKKKNLKSDGFNLPVSINDLVDMDYRQLTDEQKLALVRYERYRVWYLNEADSETEFNNRYLKMQAKANLSPFTDFLKEDYNIR